MWRIGRGRVRTSVNPTLVPCQHVFSHSPLCGVTACAALACMCTYMVMHTCMCTSVNVRLGKVSAVAHACTCATYMCAHACLHTHCHPLGGVSTWGRDAHWAVWGLVGRPRDIAWISIRDAIAKVWYLDKGYRDRLGDLWEGRYE